MVLLPIGKSVITGFADEDYAEFQRRIQQKVGIRLTDYKPDQMRRRISAFAERCGHQSFMSYFLAMEKDPVLMSAFLDKMTINVSELLRNPPRFDDLLHKVLPDLLRTKRPGSNLSVWSAGCSYGAEAYTLAMLFEELPQRIPYNIIGTDIDREILAKARLAQFNSADVNNVSPERRQRFFEGGTDGSHSAKAALRANISFRQHDLLADKYPAQEYDLIVCRNVVIYFTDEAKERIYRQFFAALKPGGVLFVGGTERLADHRTIGYDLVIPFFYKKPLGAVPEKRHAA